MAPRSTARGGGAAALRGIHPLFMGGEYVPPDLPGETTMVRIDLGSTTGDVTELRARPGGAFLLYRFVDEYETQFLMPFDRSEAPLSMGELIRVIDGSVGMREKPGQVWPVLDANFGRGNQWGKNHEEWLEAARRFVTVSSEFYPDLQGYYEAFVEEWVSERGLLDGPAGSGGGSASGREAC